MCKHNQNIVMQFWRFVTGKPFKESLLILLVTVVGFTHNVLMFYSLPALLSYFQISLILLDEISSCPALTATHKISSLLISPKFAMTAYMIRLSGLERFTEATIDV